MFGVSLSEVEGTLAVSIVGFDFAQPDISYFEYFLSNNKIMIQLLHAINY